MNIEELHNLTDEQVQDLLNLMKELDDTVAVTASMLRAAVSEPSTHFFAAVDGGRIVGCASLCVTRHPLGLKGMVEDVVVSSKCRGLGIGRLLMEHIVNFAQGLAPIELCLTSRPARVSANKLYRAIGFQPYETNVYKLIARTATPTDK